MSTYQLPDITGRNPKYLQTNLPYYVYQVGMKLHFKNSPVFVSSIIIALTDGTSRRLVKDTDWEVRDDDIDQYAMQQAFLENNGFAETLVKSVTIKSALALKQRVAVTIQQFYLTNPGMTYDDGQPFEFTPDNLKSLISGLADVRQQIARVQSPVSPNDNAPALLPFDINGTLDSNKIVGEIIPVNTVSGAKVIRLSQGAYFADSLTLRFNGVPLDPTKDYLPIVNSSLTAQTTNKSGIYHHILINGSFAGNIVADYRAVGGEVQLRDIAAIYENMLAIKNYLNDGIFVTSDTITETPAFRSTDARLLLLEDNVRRLLSGTPTYNDASPGIAVTRPIQAPDSDIHWYTIAKLYKVQGSNDIINADQFKARVYLPSSKIALAFTLDFNMDQTRAPASFRTDALIFDPGYKLFSDISVAAPQWPLVRVVWNNAAQSFSGAYIQFGVPLPSLSDRMVVENMSSNESCWIMSRDNEYLNGNTAVPVSSPQDSGFVLPDGASIWAAASNVSFSETFVPTYENGYLAYAGSAVQLTALSTINSTASSFNIVLPKVFPIQKIRTLVVTMLSADSSQVYDVNIPLTGSTDTKRTGRATFVDTGFEAMSMMATVTRDNQNNITISLNISEIANQLTTGTASPKTDVVRYIRARV